MRLLLLGTSLSPVRVVVDTCQSVVRCCVREMRFSFLALMLIFAAHIPLASGQHANLQCAYNYRGANNGAVSCEAYCSGHWEVAGESCMSAVFKDGTGATCQSTGMNNGGGLDCCCQTLTPAAGATASLSTSLHGAASNCIDGYFNNMCHTDAEPNPWIRISFAAPLYLQVAPLPRTRGTPSGAAALLTPFGTTLAAPGCQVVQSGGLLPASPRTVCDLAPAAGGRRVYRMHSSDGPMQRPGVLGGDWLQRAV